MAPVKQLLLMLVSVVAIAGCKKAAEKPSPRQGMAHTDHTGKHGGLVQMFGDLHTETVFGASGEHELHLSGPTREPWPASTIMTPVFIVKRPGAEPERLQLSAAADDSHWSAHGKPLAEPRTMVRLEFVWKGTPQFIDVPAMLADHAKHQH